MSERSERLFEALSGIEEQKIDEAAPEDRTGRFRWRKWGVLAAALAVVIGAGSYVLPRLGGSAGAGGAGSDGASTFMAYAGPVFPLTLKEADSSLTAQREITLDFAPWTPVWWSNKEEADSRDWLTPAKRQEVLDDYNEWYPEGGQWKSSTDIQVTDAYTLTNTSSEDKTVSVLYPFASSVDELGTDSPVLTAGGQELETTLHAGQYSGGFEGAWGAADPETGSCNLDLPESWKDYKAVLAGGSCLEKALGTWPDLSGVPAIVYEFTDPWGEPEDEKAGVPNPSIRVYFHLDYSRTRVLTTGFHAGYYDREKSLMGKGFSIPQPGERGYGMDCWNLIVVGEDITGLRTEGRVTGGWDNDRAMEAGVTVRRYETDLDTALRTLYLDEQWAAWEKGPGLTEEMYRGLFYDHLLTYGLLSDASVERYDDGMLENEFARLDRVFYLEAEVDIPAGESVTLKAEMTKEGSYDFACTHTENKGVYGYDMVTELGSNLPCTGQTAVLEDRGQIQIVRQNFGFDLANGVKKVTLDPEAEHYYLEVKRIPEK